MRILITSEFLTAPLFALLMGVGAELAQQRRPRRPLAPEFVRAAALFGIGWGLMHSRAQVAIVLAHLAVLAILCLPLSRFRTRPLALTGVLFAALAFTFPKLYARGWHPEIIGPLGGQEPYRLTAFVLYAIAGMLLVRALRSPWGERAGGVWIAAIIALGTMGALLIATNLTGIVEVHAYDGTVPETLGNLAGSVGIVLLLWAIFELGPGRRLPAGVRALLAAPGQMALTLYVVQVGVLHAYEVRTNNARDDSWTMLAALMGVSLGLTVVWFVLVRTPLARRWPGALRRGPLEGVIGGLEALVR